ncbi:HU family DNA-binding protein [bacterium]|nr:HU family DNA-binding protein [bacterium]
MARGKSILWRLQNLGLTRREAELALDEIIEGLRRGLLEEGRVRLSGFGSFTVRQRRPRNVNLPDRARRKAPARKTVRFKPSPAVFRPEISLERSPGG